MKLKTIIFALCTLQAPLSLAHTALMSCYSEGNGYISCDGGFSNGASAQGVQVRIEQNGVVIMQTQLDEYGEITFKKPQNEFTVVFDGGEGHRVYIADEDIVK